MGVPKHTRIATAVPPTTSHIITTPTRVPAPKAAPAPPACVREDDQDAARHQARASDGYSTASEKDGPSQRLTIPSASESHLCQPPEHLHILQSQLHHPSTHTNLVDVSTPSALPRVGGVCQIPNHNDLWRIPVSEHIGEYLQIAVGQDDADEEVMLLTDPLDP